MKSTVILSDGKTGDLLERQSWPQVKSRVMPEPSGTPALIGPQDLNHLVVMNPYLTKT